MSIGLQAASSVFICAWLKLDNLRSTEHKLLLKLLRSQVAHDYRCLARDF